EEDLAHHRVVVLPGMDQGLRDAGHPRQGPLQRRDLHEVRTRPDHVEDLFHAPHAGHAAPRRPVDPRRRTGELSASARTVDDAPVRPYAVIPARYASTR